MSEQIEEVVSKFKDIFEGRDEEVKSYLFKNYILPFSRREVIDVERIDSSERIKKSGFHKNLSSWRNYYENIIISSCVKVKNQEKRFDYKFLFTKEKLDENTIETIEESLKEVERLKRAFKFKEAAKLVDELLEMIEKEEDRIYNRRLIKAKQEILEEEKRFGEDSEKFDNLEKDLEYFKENDDLKAQIKTLEKLKALGKDLRKGNAVRKYDKELKDTQKELDFQKQLARLEKSFEKNRKRRNMGTALSVGDEIVNLADKSDKPMIADKYKEIMAQMNLIIDAIKEKVDDSLVKSDEYLKNKEFEEAFAELDISSKLVEENKFPNHKEYLDKINDKRQEISDAQEEFIKFSDDVTEIDRKLLDTLNNRKIFQAKNYCEALIDISKKNENPGLEMKYDRFLNLINTKIEELKDRIEKVLQQSSELADDHQYEDALINIDLMLRFLENNLPDYKTKLEDKRTEVLEKEDNYNRYMDEIAELDEKLKGHMAEQDFVGALATCDRIVQISHDNEDPDLIAKYDKILDDIKEKVQDLKENIEESLKESTELAEKNRFKEALVNIDTIMDLIGDQDMPDEKRKLLKKRNEIIDAQEKYIKFAEDLTDLERQLQENLDNNNLTEALSNCDLLIHVAESSNKPELVDKYREILKRIYDKLGNIKNQIDEVLAKSDELVYYKQFDEALTSIDAMLENIKNQDLPDYELRLDQKKKAIIVAQNNYFKTTEQISQLDDVLNDNLSEDKLHAALLNCEAILHTAKQVSDQELIDKYSKILSKINKEIDNIKEKVDDVLVDAATLREEQNFDDALIKLDAMLELIDQKDLPYIKEQIERKRKEIVTAKESFEKEQLEKPKVKEAAVKEIITKDYRSQLDYYQKKLEAAQEEANYKDAVHECEKLILLSQLIEDEDLETKFDDLLIKLKQDYEKQKIEQVKSGKFSATTSTQVEREVKTIMQIQTPDGKFIDLSRIFAEMKQRLLLNVENLRLGGVYIALQRAIDKILDDGLDNVNTALKSQKISTP